MFMRSLFALLLLSLVPASADAAKPAEGRWVIRASGRPILLLELRRDPSAKGGWAGGLIRPIHFEAGSDFMVFSHVEGPAIKEPIVSSIERADEIELAVQGRSELNQLIWKPSEEGGGTIQYRDFHFPPISFAPAAIDEQVPSEWDRSKTYTVVPEWSDNAEMGRIYDADQAARQNPATIDWAILGPEDKARRQQVRALLDAGKLRSGTDFYRAAFIYQHGSRPDDFLLAHTLAVIAAARGRSDATWIASATLDRYLQSVGQKQIYGTQFTAPPGKTTTQEPYDRTIVSDSLRSALGVPSIPDQEKQRQEFEAEAKRRRPVTK
jgi:hypothetical protein